MNVFSNDGSFMERFLKRQRSSEEESSNREEQSTSGYNGSENYYQGHQDIAGYNSSNDYYSNNSYHHHQPPPPSHHNQYPPPPPPPSTHHHQQSPYSSNTTLPPHLQGNNKPTEPTKIVWAGNVHPDSTEDEIRNLFSQFGYIQAIKIIPAKQCAFITYIDVNSAIAAQYNLNGTPIRGYPLKLGFGKVESAPQFQQQLPPQQQQNQPFKPSHHLQEEVPTKNLWLGNIGPSVTSETLKQLFDPFGNVDNIRILVGRGCAFVNFFTVESAMAAKNSLSGTMVCGMPLKINFRKEDESYKSRFGSNQDDQSQPSQSQQPTRPGMRPPRPPRENQIPLPAPPPQNPAEQQIIDRFAEYVHRVGPRLEGFTLEKQKNNPLFIFLKPRNPNNDYYKWKLWTIKNPDTHSSTPTQPIQTSPNNSNNNNNNSINNSQQQPPPPQQLQQPQQQLQQNYPSTYLTDNEVLEFKEILSNLSSSRQSILGCKNWVMAHSSNSLEVISLIVVYFQDYPNLPFPQKLNILHVLNDCLHNSAVKRSSPEDWVSDEFARSIKEYLPFIIGTVSSGESNENQEKVLKVLGIWENQKFYDIQFIDSLKSEATDEDNE